MEALHLLQTRRSPQIPDLKEPGPSPDELETILKAAIRVPDHGKLAPWRFILFEGDARLKAGERIAAVFQSDHPKAGAEHVESERLRLAQAPLVIAVVSRAAPHVKIPEWEQVLSAGAVAMNLVLAIHAFGYAAKWITEWYAYDERVRAAFGLQPHERVAGFVHVGTVDTPLDERPRPELSEIVTRFDGSK